MIGKRIVVVCTANMIRSPFVAGLLASGWPTTAGGLTVESAGTAAREGRAAADDVIRIGAAYGLGLEGHRTRRLDERILRAGDTVLCAERAHRRVVLDLRPDLLPSVFTVREFGRLVESPSVRSAASTWPQLVLAASRARLVERPVVVEDDDIVDPIGRAEHLWTEFERQATEAVSAILGAVAPLLAQGTESDVPGEPQAGGREMHHRPASLTRPWGQGSS